MKFEFFKKSIIAATVVVLSSSSFVSLAVSAAENHEVVSVIEQRGTGGSNPIVVERLRQEGLARQAARLEEEAMQNFVDNTNVSSSIDTRYETQLLPVYVPDFKTLGDVQKEEQAEIEMVKNVTHENLNKAIETRVSSLLDSKFETQFSDIQNETQEVQDSIVILDAMNIVSGQKNGEFVPQETITRKEAVKISTLISGNIVEPQKESSVTDIDSSDWSVPYIELALENDIIHTDENNNFEGDMPVTADEAFALYLISAGVSVDLEDEKFPFYSEFKTFYTPTLTVTNYETDLAQDVEISRGDFAELSVVILNALLENPEYLPAEELTGAEYSASQALPSNREMLFPEIFQK